jgi:predicted dehydrogenase
MGVSELRIGLIGLDMSHAVDFTERLNDPSHPEYVAGGRVVAGWPGGSDDFELSRSRVAKFTTEVREKFGVAILDSPEDVARDVDLILITAADGRAHRSLFERIVKFKKPTFIEKPLATSAADAEAIVHLAREANVPMMSCSTIRFADTTANAVNDQSLGAIIGCDVFGPMPEEPTQPGLFWYGVHGIEVLNVVVGRGCRLVSAFRNDDYDVVTAEWNDGRIGTFRGMRKGEWKFGMTLHRERGFQHVDLLHNSWFKRTLEPMVRDLPKGRSPVDPRDTLEIMRIIEAANLSRLNGGAVRVAPQ